MNWDSRYAMGKNAGPLTRAIAALQSGKVTSTQLVNHSIESLEKYSDTLNVMAHKSYDDALQQAKMFDSGQATGAMLGAPALIKDLQNVKGMPTKKGSVAFKNAKPEEQDDATPAKLRASGFIFVGKSTLPEFGCNGYTANDLTGVTTNPWNTKLSPGGSSGGSAAALSAGLVFAATGTDGGGSIRTPAGYCGLLGLKPTNGMIGRWPAQDWIDYSTDGLLANSADDLQIIYNILKTPTAGDPASLPLDAVDFLDNKQYGVGKVYAAERTSPFGKLPTETAKKFKESVEAFGKLMKREVIWMEPRDIFPEGNPDLEWYNAVSADQYTKFGKQWVDKHWNKLTKSGKDFLTIGKGVDLQEYMDLRRKRFTYIKNLDDLLDGNGLLLTPTNPSPGFAADGSYNPPAKDYNESMQNVTGVPAISIPFGTCSNGLPFGLQVTALHYQDNRLINIASKFQKAYPWKQLAPGYDGFEGMLS